MKELLSKFNLGDTYEINARVLPSMLIVIPISLLIVQLGWKHQNYLEMIGWGAGIEIVFAIMVSKIGHAMGVRKESKLIKIWGGLPTHVWLRKTDKTHSEQQKSAWRRSVSALSGLDVEKAVQADGDEEADRVISDAIMTCRNKIRGTEGSELLHKQNISYGFSRNLAGLKWLAFTVSLCCLSSSLYGTIYRGLPIEGTLVQAGFFLIALVYLWLSDSYVQHCANRYAELFFSVVDEYK
jgi:hypothetical protein